MIFFKVINLSDAALSSSVYWTCIRKMKQDIAIEFLHLEAARVCPNNKLPLYLLDILEFILFVSLGNFILDPDLMSWRD